MASVMWLPKSIGMENDSVTYKTPLLSYLIQYLWVHNRFRAYLVTLLSGVQASDGRQYIGSYDTGWFHPQMQMPDW